MDRRMDKQAKSNLPLEHFLEVEAIKMFGIGLNRNIYVAAATKMNQAKKM